MMSDHEKKKKKINLIVKLLLRSNLNEYILLISDVKYIRIYKSD